MVVHTVVWHLLPPQAIGCRRESVAEYSHALSSGNGVGHLKNRYA